MGPSPITILYAFIGGLILAGVIGWVRRNRLTLLAPKVFIYSHVSKSGQLAELTIFNRGFKTEESVEISLNPRLRYELVGKTSDNISLLDGKINISKLGSGTDVTLIMLAEGGEFLKTDIVGCVSKDSVGVVYDSLDLVPVTANQRVWLVIIFLMMPAIILLIFLKYSDEGREFLGGVDTEKTEIAQQADKKDVNSLWEIGSAYKHLSGPLYEDFESKKIQAEILHPVVKKNIATIPISLKNNASYPIEISVSMISAHSEKEIEKYRHRLSGIILFPGKKVDRSINVAVLSKSLDESDRTVFIEMFMEQSGTLNSDTLLLKKSLLVEGQAL